MRASVPFATPTHADAPQNSANSFSKAATSGPLMKAVLSTTRAMAASISPLIRRYWARRSTIGMGVFMIRGRSLPSGFPGPKPPLYLVDQLLACYVHGMRPSPLVRELRQSKPFPSNREEAFVSILRTADLLRWRIAEVLEPEGITLSQFNVLRI